MLSHIGPIASAVNHYQNLLFGSPEAIEKLSEIISADEKNNAKISTTLIGALSDETRDKVSEKPNYNSHEVRLGSGAATIIDFDLIAAGVINPHEIPVQAETELIIKIGFIEDLTNISVGFALVTIDGTYVFGTNLFMMQVPLINGEGGNCYAVKFMFVSCLAGGEYYLNVGCNQFIDGADKFIDVRRSVARIKFSDTPGVVGFVNLGVLHEMIDLNINRISTI
jgi:lipopolysaccharide transport system ATP-binding protein